jgi:hypothetical protein
MIRTLRALFLARLLREKLLLVAFVVLGVAILCALVTNIGRRAQLVEGEQRRDRVLLGKGRPLLFISS